MRNFYTKICVFLLVILNVTQVWASKEDPIKKITPKEGSTIEAAAKAESMARLERSIQQSLNVSLANSQSKAAFVYNQFRLFRGL